MSVLLQQHDVLGGGQVSDDGDAAAAVAQLVVPVAHGVDVDDLAGLGGVQSS